MALSGMQLKNIMMNNGTVDPMPEPFYNTLLKYCKIQATNPFDCYNFFPTKREEVHTKLAAFINESPDEVVINRNTTEGMNVIANGLDLHEGGEVIISTQEHPGCYEPWKMKAKRHSITVTEVFLGIPPKSADEVVNAFQKAITPRTKALCVACPIYLTGLVPPLKELNELTHKNNIILSIDGAHAIGMLNLDVKKLGIDSLASSPYKWYGAPTGCGILYVKTELSG